MESFSDKYLPDVSLPNIFKYFAGVSQKEEISDYEMSLRTKKIDDNLTNFPASFDWRIEKPDCIGPIED